MPAQEPWRHDYRPRLAEDVGLGRVTARLFGVSTAVGGLSAAALPARKVNAPALPFETPDGVEPGLRHEQVRPACGEQVHMCGRGWVASNQHVSLQDALPWRQGR